jgi:hypothetical protein
MKYIITLIGVVWEFLVEQLGKVNMKEYWPLPIPLIILLIFTSIDVIAGGIISIFYIIIGAIALVIGFITKGMKFDHESALFVSAMLIGLMFMQLYDNKVTHIKEHVKLTENKVTWKGYTKDVESLRSECSTRLYRLRITEHTIFNFSNADLKINCEVEPDKVQEIKD